MRRFYLAFSLIAITNEPLMTDHAELVQQLIKNIAPLSANCVRTHVKKYKIGTAVDQKHSATLCQLCSYTREEFEMFAQRTNLT